MISRAGKEIRPGDRVVDVNSGEILLVERLQPGQTANVVASPISAAPGLWRDNFNLVHLDEALAMLRTQKPKTP